MSSPTERIELTEQQLAKVQSLQQMLDEMHRELTAYREVLSRRLSSLQHQEAAPVVPKRGSAQGTGPGVVPPKRDSAQGTAPGVAAPKRDSAQGTGPAVVPPKRDSGQGTDPEVVQPRRGSPQGLPTLPPEAEPSPEDRRTSPRRKGNPVPVMLTDAAGAVSPFQGWVVDRSGGGLRILVDQSVSPGSVLSVRPSKAHASFPWIQVKVCSCQPERSSWALGVQFMVKPAWGELQAFG